MSAVDDLHESLNYKSYEARLRALGGAWTLLQSLESKARNNRSQLKAYETTLKRTIAKLDQETLEALDGSGLDLACQQYVELYTRLSESTLDTRALRGGRTIEAWAEKWLPSEYRRYTSALQAASDAPTKSRFAALMTATQELFDAYAGAIQRNA